MIDDRPPGPFAGVPLLEQIAEWRRWPIREKRPEDHPAVSPYRFKPPLDSDIADIGDVSLQSTWTNQAAIQCNVCSREHKFLTKGIIVSCSNGWWYVVGPECSGAGAEFIEKVTRASNARRKREAEEIADRYLAGFLSVRSEWIDFWHGLSAPLKTIQDLRRLLHDGSEHIVNDFAAAYRDDGKLHLWPRDRKQQHYDTFGKMKGGAFFVAEKLPLALYRQVSSGFSLLLKPDAPLEDVHAEILRMEAKGTLKVHAENHKSVLNRIRKLDDIVQDAATFLEHNNLLTVERWIAHERSVTRIADGYNHKFKITERRGLTSFLINDQTFEIDLRPIRDFALRPPQ